MAGPSDDQVQPFTANMSEHSPSGESTKEEERTFGNVRVRSSVSMAITLLMFIAVWASSSLFHGAQIQRFPGITLYIMTGMRAFSGLILFLGSIVVRYVRKDIHFILLSVTTWTIGLVVNAASLAWEPLAVQLPRYNAVSTDLGILLLYVNSGLPTKWSVPIALATSCTFFGATYGPSGDITEFEVLVLLEALFVLFAGFFRKLQGDRLEASGSRERRRVVKERQKLNRLVSAILPKHVAAQLLDGAEYIGEDFDEVTVLFCGILSGSPPSSPTTSRRSSTQGPHGNEGYQAGFLSVMNTLYDKFDLLVDQYGVHTVERLRETYIVVGGTKWQSHVRHHTEVMAHLALDMLSAAEESPSSYSFGIRVGLHTGPLTAAVVGQTAFHYSLFGNTVNIASRMMTAGQDSRVQASEQTVRLLLDQHCAIEIGVEGAAKESEAPDTRLDLLVTSRGCIPVKGIGKMQTYWVTARRDLEPIQVMPLPLSLSSRWSKSVARLQDLFQIHGRYLSYASSRRERVRTLSLGQRWEQRGSSELASEKVRLHPITLYFEDHPEYETKFLQEYVQSGLKIAFIVTIMAALAFAVRVPVLLFEQLEKQPDEPGMVYFNAFSSPVVFIIFTLMLRVFGHRSWRQTRTVIFIMSLTWATAWVEITRFLYHAPDSTDLRRLGMGLNTGMVSFLMLTAFFRLGAPLNMIVLALAVSGDQILHWLMGWIWSGTITRGVVLIMTGLLSCYIERMFERQARLLFLLQVEVRAQKERSAALLCTLLPPHAVDQVMTAQPSPQPTKVECMQMTIVQADVVDFSGMSRDLHPTQVARVLNNLYTAFDERAAKRNLCKLYTIGDAYVAVGGIPNTAEDHVAACCSFALDMIRILRDVNRQNAAVGLPSNINVRIGVSSGMTFGGVVGHRKPFYLIWGRAVVECEELETNALPGRIRVGATVLSSLKESSRMVLREGKNELKDEDVVGRFVFELASEQASCRNLSLAPSVSRASPQVLLPLAKSVSWDAALASPPSLDSNEDDSVEQASFYLLSDGPQMMKPTISVVPPADSEAGSKSLVKPPSTQLELFRSIAGSTLEDQGVKRMMHSATLALMEPSHSDESSTESHSIPGAFIRSVSAKDHGEDQKAFAMGKTKRAFLSFGKIHHES